MRNTFKILFYIKRSSVLRNGQAPIMGRITIDGQRAQLSTHLSVPPVMWNARMGCATGNSRLAEQINARLNDIRFQIGRCYDALFFERQTITPQKVRELYRGKDHHHREGIVHFFRTHNAEFGKMVGVNRSLSTYYKYRCVCAHLETFVRMHYGCPDVPFERLDREFLSGFHNYIANQSPHKTNTVWIYLIALKHILSLAFSRGLIDRNLFSNYKLHSEFRPREYLTMQELMRMVALDLDDTGLELVRDAYLFSCFTGLSYVDIKSLTMCHIKKTGKQIWIHTTRKKTGAAVQVRLFELPGTLLMKHMPDSQTAPIFPLPTNGWCNACLEKIARKTDIERHITFHTARHTFATTVTLSQGMPIETISKLLGHRDIRTTQIYAAVTHDQLSRELEHLSRKIDSICSRKSCAAR